MIINKKIGGIIVFLVLFALNLQITTKFSKQATTPDLLSIISENTAFGQTEACVTVTFYEHNMEQCWQTTDCWDENHELCGIQKCCEFTSFYSNSCNETSCE